MGNQGSVSLPTLPKFIQQLSLRAGLEPGFDSNLKLIPLHHNAQDARQWSGWLTPGDGHRLLLLPCTCWLHAVSALQTVATVPLILPRVPGRVTGISNQGKSRTGQSLCLGKQSQQHASPLTMAPGLLELITAQFLRRCRGLNLSSIVGDYELRL